jgi:hypothetical protein
MRAARQIAIFLVFVVGIVLLLSLFFGGGKKAKKTTPTNFNITQYINTDSQVVAITDGPINGDDAHRAIRITVDRNSRRIDVVQGYKGNVIVTKSYDNNQKAYDQFLHALALANFGKPRTTTIASEDGVCATGRRFVFEAFNNGDSISRTWTANCMRGNTTAVPSRVTDLFRRQITDYDTIIKNQRF